MATEKVDVLIQGGKATAAPPLGPALGPLGVNIGLVVAEINKKTAAFAGMNVPVTVEVDKETKTFTISIGTPPAADLIKQEAGVATASGNPKQHVGNLTIDQVIKVAGMKEDALLGANMKSCAKEIAGTCNSMGITVEGMHGRDAIAAINAGKFDSKFK